MFAGRVKIKSHSSCRTSAILKYFCLLGMLSRYNLFYLLVLFHKISNTFHFQFSDNYNVYHKCHFLLFDTVPNRILTSKNEVFNTPNTFLFLFSNQMLVIKAGNHKVYLKGGPGFIQASMSKIQGLCKDF